MNSMGYKGIYSGLIRNRKKTSFRDTYTHYPDTTIVVGYIVNVHDPFNYDIDLLFSNDYRRRYSRVVNNNYKYTRMVNGKEIEYEGTAYRCRIRGIGIVRDVPNKYNQIAYEAHNELTKKFNRQNGWILCIASDVDIYNRLLVDIFDPVTGENISNILLRQNYRPLFQPYAKIRR